MAPSDRFRAAELEEPDAPTRKITWYCQNLGLYRPILSVTIKHRHTTSDKRPILQVWGGTHLKGMPIIARRKAHGSISSLQTEWVG